MSHRITPHEPEEKVLSSVEEAFREAEESRVRWQAWEQKQQLRAVSIALPREEYAVLEHLALRQGKTVPQLAQALLNNILSTFVPLTRAHPERA